MGSVLLNCPVTRTSQSLPRNFLTKQSIANVFKLKVDSVYLIDESGQEVYAAEASGRFTTMKDKYIVVGELKLVHQNVASQGSFNAHSQFGQGGGVVPTGAMGQVAPAVQRLAVMSNKRVKASKRIEIKIGKLVKNRHKNLKIECSTGQAHAIQVSNNDGSATVSYILDETMRSKQLHGQYAIFTESGTMLDADNSANNDFDFLTSKKLFCCERVELDDEDLVENHNGFGSTSGATGGKKKSVKENIDLLSAVTERLDECTITMTSVMHRFDDMMRDDIISQLEAEKASLGQRCQELLAENEELKQQLRASYFNQDTT